MFFGVRIHGVSSKDVSVTAEREGSYDLRRLLSRSSTYLYTGISLSLLLVFVACSNNQNQIPPQQAPLSQPTPQPTITIEQADTTISGLIQSESFSGSVLYASNGKVLLDKGYSMADWRHKIANTPHTQFAIGDLTKGFTALAIMMLQERGKLHVQDHICMFISNCPSAWQPITIHMLLSHTSGLPGNMNRADLRATEALPVSPERTIIELKNEPLDHPPGAGYGYGNSDYIVLGVIIEKVSGGSYADFLRQNIFAPLHMNSTGVAGSAAVVSQIPNLAVGYTSWQQPADNSNLAFLPIYAAASGIYSTVEDLYLWDQALYAQKLVSRQSLNQMFTGYVNTNEQTFCIGYVPMTTSGVCPYYGYGWYSGNEAGHKVNENVGFYGGYLSYMQHFPDDNITIIVLSNLQNASFSTVSPTLESVRFHLPQSP
jgi:CubicO group peptidase (beta-lactamase class C family)